MHRKNDEILPGNQRITGLLRWGGLGAALLYLSFTLLLGSNGVGLHYDEAILQHGAVHMLNSASEPTFIHNRGSWVLFAGRYWPLAIIPYCGAVKDYVLLLPFALFGPSAEVARAVNALLGAFGIFGIATLLRNEISAGVGAAVGFIIALHPAYLDQTLYDYGVIVVWMAIVGLISIGISYYKKRRSALAVFLIGLTMGVGVWNRVNFAWFLGSALIASGIVFRKRLLIPIRHVAALICGGFIGVFPMLLFQVLSDWVILGFIKGSQSQESFGPILIGRIRMLSEILISDGEQRGIWNGPPVPLWQVYFFPILLLFALITCFTLKRAKSESVIAWRRVSALTLIIFALIMLTSRLGVRDHHLVALVPVTAVVAVLAFQGLIEEWKGARVFAVAVSLVYVGSALFWNVAAARGLAETGGVNKWSDGIYAVSNYLTTNHKGREIQVLDWGLDNSLYVLSNAKIQSREVFWGATTERTGSGIRWTDLIGRGGVLLTSSDGNMSFPVATSGFLAALAVSGRQYRRIEFNQRGGAPYAYVIEILPLVEPGQPPPSMTSAQGTLSADPNPIKVCLPSRSGITMISWKATGTSEIEVRVGRPNGDLLVKSGPNGAWPTAEWVVDGTVFYLQDVSNGRPLTGENTIATLTVHLTSEGCTEPLQ